MNLKLDKQALEYALSFSARAVQTKKGARLETRLVEFLFRGGKLYFYTHDGMHFSQVCFGDVPAVEAKCYLEFSPLADIVSLSKDPEIEMEFSSGSVLIKSGSSEYTMQFVNGNDMSFMFRDFNPDDKPIVEVPVTDFKNIEAFLTPCVPAVGIRAEFRGVFYDGNFVSSDGSSLAFRWYANTKSKHTLFMSVDSFHLLTILAITGETAKFYEVGNKCIVRIGPADYVITLMASKFPKYEKFTEKTRNHKYKAFVPKEQLKTVCKKLTNFVGDVKKAILLTFDADSLTIQASNENRKGKEIIPVRTEGGPKNVSFAVNLEKLTEFVARILIDEPIITFDDQTDIFGLYDGNSYYAMATLRKVGD